MKTEEFKSKLVNCCFISKELIYVDNKKAIELINQFEKDILTDFVQSIGNKVEYIDGRQYKYKYRDFVIPVIEYNELIELAAKYDKK